MSKEKLGQIRLGKKYTIYPEPLSAHGEDLGRQPCRGAPGRKVKEKEVIQKYTIKLTKTVNGTFIIGATKLRISANH